MNKIKIFYNISFLRSLILYIEYRKSIRSPIESFYIMRKKQLSPFLYESKEQLKMHMSLA
jgi:hypothetical protein